ncbi:hypothetical protein EXN66_Car010603 [Channa argus]|uniref:Uncharacterized protein n=1 Tax=Channa argus TaxID=215402 RepID=A0A6G1PXG1_CHAAH|nr:hypothetical protein EXN66_Car010603 [Channa argus]
MATSLPVLPPESVDDLHAPDPLPEPARPSEGLSLGFQPDMWRASTTVAKIPAAQPPEVFSCQDWSTALPPASSPKGSATLAPSSISGMLFCVPP